LAAFTACENSQVAQVVSFTKDPKGPHSVFTWYLYHALQGEADLRRDGKISFASVAKYVQDSVKHDGYPQVPQYEFQPESLGNETLETQVVKAEAPIIRPHRIGYALKAGTGISSADVEKIHSTIGRYIPALQWTDKQDEATAIIVIEKRGNLYLAQISDSTGAVWEGQHGTTLDEALKGLLGNLRALYVQASISALRNPASRADFDIKYGIRGNASRSAGEVVKGDVIVLNGKTKTPGYLYIFSVDTMGVIHPLYPMPESGPERLESNRSVVIGADNSFTVQEPFGRDMIFAFLVPKQYDSLAAFWNEDDIGDLGDSGISEQERFLNVLWSALTANGKPRGDWRGKVIVLRSFPK
jgi:hypothetical protein